MSEHRYKVAVFGADSEFVDEFILWTNKSYDNLELLKFWARDNPKFAHLGHFAKVETK